jgi:hypothetical protein
MRHGLHRRPSAIVAGMLLASVLSSCGFDYATNRVNTISSSVNNREGAVDVLAAAVISGAPDSGVFVATLSNSGSSSTDAAELGGTTALVGLSGAVTPVEGLEPVDIQPLGVDNLYQRGGIVVNGTFALGDFVGVELTFDNGQVTTIEVPVVRPCYEYDPGKWPLMELPGEVPEGETEFEAETEAGEGGDATTTLTDPYSCEPVEPEPFGHSEEGEGEEEEGAETETGVEE